MQPFGVLDERIKASHSWPIHVKAVYTRRRVIKMTRGNSGHGSTLFASSAVSDFGRCCQSTRWSKLEVR